MTEQEQQIAIAESCGWKDCHRALGGFDAGDGVTERYVIGIPPNCSFYKVLPVYLKDLNACHEFEKTLSDEQKLKYYHYICVAVRRENGQSDHESIYAPLHTTHATAAQRSEAYLKTLKLWRP